MAEEKDNNNAEEYNKDDVDSVLEEKFSSSEKTGNRGIEQIIKTGFVSYERMPMLENVFDRLSRFLSIRLRGYTNDLVDVKFNTMKSLRFGDFIESVPTSSVYAIFKIEEWNKYGIFVVDAELAYSIINILMGGNKETLHVDTKRAFTSLELELIKNMIVSVLHEFNKAFDPIEKIHFKLDRLEINSSMATIVRPSNASVSTRFNIDLGDCGGNLDLIIPFSALEAVRDKLSEHFTGESDGSDNIWEHHLLSEILEANVTMSASLNKTTMTLHDVLKLKEGSVINFPANPDNIFAVTLDCDDTIVGNGTLGKIRKTYAVNFDERTLPPEEEITKEKLIELFNKEKKD